MVKGLTHTGERFCSEARLAAAQKAAGSVDTRVSQLGTASLLYDALIYICGEKNRSVLLPPSACSRCSTPYVAVPTVTRTRTDDPILTYTALSIWSHYVPCGAGAAEGARAVNAKDITLTGLQARHCSQRTLIYICI